MVPECRMMFGNLKDVGLEASALVISEVS